MGCMVSALAVAFAVLFGFAGTAGAAEPYSGATTTTTPARLAPAILIAPQSADPGQTVRVRACHYQADTRVQFTIDGKQVASPTTATEPPRTCDPPFDAARSGGDPYAEGSFVLPSTLVRGDHFVCAVSAGYPTPCATVAVGGAQVLAVTLTQPDSGSSSNSILAFTGFALLFWLAMALVIVMLGWICVRWARDRRNAPTVSS